MGLCMGRHGKDREYGKDRLGGPSDEGRRKVAREKEGYRELKREWKK